MPKQTVAMSTNEEATAAEAAPETCGECAAALLAGDRFCACCGTPVRRICHECGEELHHSVAIYCPHCGRKLPV